VDQDSGRKAGRSVPRRENGSGPRHRLDTDRPSGAANPLPRRSAQGHIEPQLRIPGGAGTGTPFTPFGPDHERAPAAAESGEEDDASAAADFHEGTSRGRNRTEPPAG
jgi:hypothetical protein